MLEGLSPLHLILILGIVLIIVGPRRLPELGSALGKSLREFREATSGLTDELSRAAAPVATPSAGAPAPTAPPETAADGPAVPTLPAVPATDASSDLGGSRSNDAS